MCTLDDSTYSEVTLSLVRVTDFFNNIVSWLEWRTDEKDIFMDVGCGPGDVTKQMMPILFPKLKKLIAVDLLPNMIEQAKKKNFHPMIEYHVASIEDWTTVDQWEGKIAKLISSHCFIWLKDQKQGFQNVHRLLRRDGEAAFYIVLQTSFYNAVLEAAKDSKWRRYFKAVDLHIPVSHQRNYDALHYRNMLEEIGFTVVFCNKVRRLDPFQSDKEFADFFASICVLVSHVPPSERTDFKSDFIRYLQKLTGRDQDGLPTHEVNMLEVVVKKNK